MRLGDFTTTARVIYLSALAIGIGIVSAYVALVLLRLIGLFTNLFFFQRWSFALVSPVGNTLGPAVILVPTGAAFLVALYVTPGGSLYREYFATDWDHFTRWLHGLL